MKLSKSAKDKDDVLFRVQEIVLGYTKIRTETEVRVEDDLRRYMRSKGFL